MSTEFKVGLFTILGVSATIFSIFVLSPGLFDRQERTPYYTVLSDASGIMEKTHVRTNGVNVGHVTSITLTDRATRVEMEVRADVPIPDGSFVLVRTVGFLGDRFIEIQRPPDFERMVEPGGFIPQATDPGDISEVIAILGQIGRDIKQVTENMASVLGSDHGRESMGTIVGNLEEVTENARLILEENRQNTRHIVENMKEFSQNLNSILDSDSRDRIERILANFDSSMADVQGATQRINLISEKVERGEGTLGRLVNEDKTLLELEGAIQDIRQVLSPVTKLKVGVETHAEVRQDNSTQAYFNLTFQSRPDAYYLIGFTDMTELERETTVETFDVEDPAISRTLERVRERSALRFNLQIAKRWNMFGARMGLFESTGGLAADFYLFRDRLRFSLEVFDFASDGDLIRRTAHLKAYASALFFNHIYTIVGIDDPTRLDPETGQIRSDLNFYIGAGLTFTDEDLRTLFGMAAIAAGTR